jgi:hypothetical protein
VRETKLRCSPCVNNYLNVIPAACTNSVIGQCMSDISVDSVESAINRLLAAEAPRLELELQAG